MRAKPAHTGAIIPLRVDGRENPLFLIHGVDGDVDRFQILADCIDPRWPVYGIRAQGLLGEPRGLLCVEDLARYYLAEMKRIQPRGPYFLLGYSFGGLLAFEMGRQLHRQGERVGMLAMMDNRRMTAFSLLGGKAGGPAPTSPAEARWTSYSKRLLSPGGLKFIRDKLCSRSFRGLYTVAHALKVPIPPFLQRAYEINWFAAVRYVPRRYSGPIIHFWSSRSLQDGGPQPGEWTDVAESVETIHIEGPHSDLIKAPYAAGVAKKVNACLERLAGKDET